MNLLTRRRFLIASGVTGAAGLAAGATAYGLREIMDTAGERPTGAKTLVLVTLYGGNDGLGTVIPFADPAYQDARPELAYGPDDVLRLDESFGLNPGLAGLHARYGAGRMAVVHGVGYPKPDRSHFRSMDIWQTGQPERPGSTGWLGRWLDTAGRDPRLAVSFEPALPPVLAGAASAGASVPVGGRDVKFPTDTLAALGAASPGEPPLQARAAACFADLVAVDALFDPAIAGTAGEDDADQEPATATGGRSDLAAQLDLVARCVEANVATRVYSVSLGGFDTHADEKRLQETLLKTLDKALTGFLDRMSKTPAGRDVVVAVYSEFGRRVRANASDGTDHGTASPVLLLGDSVPGGLHGEHPSLTDLDDGDLKHTTDFRDVYATLLEGVLGADPGAILGGWSGRLALRFSAG